MALRHECFHIRKSADISLICSSPQLIAAYHVLHRLLMPRHSPYALIRLNFPISDSLESLGSLRSWIAWVSLNFFRLFTSLQLKDFPFVHWFFPPFGEIVFFYPTFYRKTYTNLLIFVLFVCSFFILFNLFLLFGFQWSIKFANFLSWLWLAQVDSNHRPRAYQARALTTWAMRHYGYLRFPHVPLVEMMGIEPMTPCLQGRCSPSWATPPSVWASFQFPYRLLKIEQQADLCFLCCTVRFLLVVFPLWFVFAYLQIRDICEWYLTFSIERRWSSRTFRYGYLVTT